MPVCNASILTYISFLLMLLTWSSPLIVRYLATDRYSLSLATVRGASMGKVLYFPGLCLRPNRSPGVWALEIEPIPLVNLLVAGNKETPWFNTAALGKLAITLPECARPQADQKEGIRAFAPAAKPSTGAVNSHSTAAVVAVYEQCSAVSSFTRVELKSIKSQ
eukprot:IDg21342t1